MRFGNWVLSLIADYCGLSNLSPVSRDFYQTLQLQDTFDAINNSYGKT
jgi:hypothetical protein